MSALNVNVNKEAMEDMPRYFITFNHDICKTVFYCYTIMEDQPTPLLLKFDSQS